MDVGIPQHCGVTRSILAGTSTVQTEQTQSPLLGKQPEIEQAFPKLTGKGRTTLVPAQAPSGHSALIRVGVVLSGGQAPGDSCSNAEDLSALYCYLQEQLLVVQINVENACILTFPSLVSPLVPPVSILLAALLCLCMQVDTMSLLGCGIPCKGTLLAVCSTGFSMALTAFCVANTCSLTTAQ